MGQIAAIYCRVSTSDQDCARQESELIVFAEKLGYRVAGVWKETASGSRNNREQQQKILALAQARVVTLS